VVKNPAAWPAVRLSADRRHHRRIVAYVLFFAHTLSSFWFTGLFTGLLTFLYFLGIRDHQGWTPGKKILGLSVHGPGGAPKPTAQQSRIRNSWTLLSIIPFVSACWGSSRSS